MSSKFGKYYEVSYWVRNLENFRSILRYSNFRELFRSIADLSKFRELLRSL